MTEVPINQKEYLKKYLGIGKAPGEKKKKKKKPTTSRVQIIDDDAEGNLPSIVIEEDPTIANEYAPQIVAIIDERPPSLRVDEKTQNPLWQPIGTVENNNQTEQKQMIKGFKIAPKTSETPFLFPDRSPPRRKKKVRDHDSSPPRTPKRDNSHGNDIVIKEERRSVPRSLSPSTHYDQSPPRKSKRADDDFSPPRKNRNGDEDFSHRTDKRKTEDSSPSRRNRKSDDDVSPPRRNRRLDDDISPPRRHKRVGNDSSPPRKSRKRDDFSPPRRSKKPDDFSHQKKPTDSASFRNRSRSRFDDNSPPRRSKEIPPRIKTERVTPERSSSVTPRREDRSGKSDEDRRPKKLEKTLDGKRAGLQDARELVEETRSLKSREEQLFKSLSSDVSGQNAETIHRERRSGKIRNLEEEEERKRKKREEEEKNKQKYAKWGRGLAQVESREQQLQEQLHEMSKPLARYADDEDLERYLKEQEREGDPMLAYIRRKKKKKAADAGEVTKPQFEGEFMPNRYGIRPGHRWDGVDRSNGYEKKWFEVQNEKRALQDESYKWSTEDM